MCTTGDHCTGLIWSTTHTGETWRVLTFLDTDLMISSFAEDSLGELYVLDLNGAVLRLIPGAPSAGETVVV